MKNRVFVLATITSAVVGLFVGAKAVGNVANKDIEKSQGKADKYLSLFQMMNRWLRIKQEGKNLDIYFEKNGYKKIAIYGMSNVGVALLDELKDSNIKVAYGIDKRAGSIYSDVSIVSADDTLEDVDAVVVTVIDSFDEIEEKLSSKVNCPIVSLEDIIFEV